MHCSEYGCLSVLSMPQCELKILWLPQPSVSTLQIRTDVYKNTLTLYTFIGFA